MKRMFALAAIVAFAFAGAAFASDVYVGSCIYKFDDTFMTGVRNAMKAEMDAQGGTLEIVDSQNRQPLQ
ncbi:MAG: methyl-galactoside ABC transporter substrate-binding protein, partial [Fretibacterium sp.]|nr:methyl-galactoside ABC transporter substrate-binding protein [Fretibacterium sp.]